MHGYPMAFALARIHSLKGTWLQWECVKSKAAGQIQQQPDEAP
jgi:hypothetical protein